MARRRGLCEVCFNMARLFHHRWFSCLFLHSSRMLLSVHPLIAQTHAIKIETHRRPPWYRGTAFEHGQQCCHTQHGCVREKTM